MPLAEKIHCADVSQRGRRAGQDPGRYLLVSWQLWHAHARPWEEEEGEEVMMLLAFCFISPSLLFYSH